MDFSFNHVIEYKDGLVESLLLNAYKHIPTITEEDRQGFEKFDQNVSEHPQWIGKYIFFTTLNGVPIGFVSFDPRQKPVAIIGHNCLLPEHKGKGVGKQQMSHALKEIRKQGFTKAVVSTCNNDYFIPAQKMYKACSFKETRKFFKAGSDVEMIEYELDLDK